MSAKAIMIQGTSSGVGKSLITAALCRIFARKGYKTAPFKSQNMALNSFVTCDGLEIGRAQAMQAEAAFKEPDARMNPVLLKPTGDSSSQVILMGEVVGNMGAKDYFSYRKQLIPTIMDAYKSLAAENDIIVIEGAGSPAEINLQKDDIVNMGMAEAASAPVFIVGDIDKGGVFASLYGTVMLIPEKYRSFVKGVIINKFRGDISLLEPGLITLENLVNAPVLGVIPYNYIDIDEEDSLSELINNKESGFINISVIRLPHISNFTDFNAFRLLKGVSVSFINNVNHLNNADMLIIPGTKNTLSDLEWLRKQGFEPFIKEFADSGKPVIGICGGFQMMTEEIADPKNVERGGAACGLGFFKSKTIFSEQKRRERVQGIVSGAEGIFENLNGKYFEGYEIHNGVTESSSRPLVCRNNIYGTYVHGFFDSQQILQAIAESLYKLKGLSYREQAADYKKYKNSNYDKLADNVSSSLDINKILEIINEGIT